MPNRCFASSRAFRPPRPCMEDNSLRFLEIGEGSERRAIAVREQSGTSPGLFWLSGYKSDMKGTKAEALARWTDEEGNVVSPDVFIRIAEDHGFVGEITRQVVKRALRDFAETLRQHPDFHISVNATAMDLCDPEFLSMLDGSLKQAKVQPKSLAIEITESSTASREEAMETIRNLRARGHSIHIDDFGTGYSNLSYLLYISVDTIKIDQAFTKVIGTDAVSAAILPQILAMAKSLGLEVIVEGIETEQQKNYFFQPTLHMYGQGWLFGRPVPAEEFHILLAENWARPFVPENSAAAKHEEEYPDWSPQHR